nr:AimR family lysis-lysogeny pheromone receptor [Bacillus cereus]
MKKLSREIDDYLSSKNKTYTDLAKEIGVAKSTVSNWINRDKEISVYTFAKISYVIFTNDKDKQEQKIIDYLGTLEDRLNINVKVAFALAHLNDHVLLIEYLAGICKESRDLEMRRFADIFNLYIDRLKGKNVREVYLNIQKVRSSNADVEIFCDILSMLILCDLGDFGLMQGYKERVEKNITDDKLVTNIHLKSLYGFWVKELWSYSILRKNNSLQFVRENGELRTYKDIDFFREALNVLNGAKGSLKYNIALNDINFIRIFWWKDINKIDFDRLHPAEYALFLVKKGKYQQAINILEEIRSKRKTLVSIKQSKTRLIESCVI